MVDWDRTVAWGEGGYYCRLFLNVAGREPRGLVAPTNYERLRQELKERIESLGDECGRPLGTVAYRPTDLYAHQRGVAPDLLVYFGDLHWRSIGLVGTRTVHLFENDTGPDDANHGQDGMYILAGPGVPVGGRQMREIRDVAPTILQLLGEPIPRAMEGRSMLATPSAVGA
jgi:predicted AlkP superfamily phosphohydrolase/phosphomutase